MTIKRTPEGGKRKDVRTIFEDKNLERVLRREEKLGVDLIFSGMDVTMMTATWMATLPRHRLLGEYRKTLAAIVEALGYIPDNEIVHIQLSKGEYVITHPLPEVIGEDVSSFLTEYEEEEEAMPMGLAMAGWWLYQTRAGEIVGCTGSGPNLNVTGTRVGARTLVRRDENTGEAVYKVTYRPREDKDTAESLDAWRYLEARQWVRWPEEEPDGEIDGQEEIGEAEG